MTIENISTIYDLPITIINQLLIDNDIEITNNDITEHKYYLHRRRKKKK